MPKCIILGNVGADEPNIARDRAASVPARAHQAANPASIHGARRGGRRGRLLAVHEAIKQHGQTERWKGRAGKYLYPGDDWRYWFMSADREESRIINRCTLADTETFRQKGWIG
jgi:hypothetical protein